MMRILFYLILFIVTYECSFNSLFVNAQEQEPVIINTYEEDLTGDGMKETIELKGILLSKDTQYYRDIWIDIESTYTKQQWKVSYGGGYKPKLKFIDLNNDQIPDLFFQNLNDIDGDHYNYHIHTFQNEIIKKVVQPQQWHISGKFNDNFKIVLNISHNEKPISINIDNKRSKYVNLGIYNAQGKLTKPTSVHIDPISMIQPIQINKDKGYGIKTTQEIRGAKTHLLGSVETLWYYENKKWIILRTEWVSE